MLVAAFQTVGRAYSSFAFASSTVDDDAILYDGVLVTFGYEWLVALVLFVVVTVSG